MFIIFVLLSFNIFKAIYNETGNDAASAIFPTLEQPDIEFLELDTNCGGVFECIRFIGQVMYNFAAGIIFVILFIINLLVFLFELFVIIIAQSFTGIAGAPFWFNVIVQLVNAAALAFIVFRSIRSGDTSA